MNNFNNEARKKAKEQKDKRQDNKQHCSKISQGLDKFDRTSINRAIWELVQNARDLSDNCKIKIELNNDYFIFSHNGSPFTPDTLGSLVKQVSAEEKENPTKVGQYGTGFITTHLFGRKIELEGSFNKEKGVRRDSNGKIKIVFLYNDGTNPLSSYTSKSDVEKMWNEYFQRLRKVSKLKVKN